MPCIKRPQTARCPLQAESERNAGLLTACFAVGQLSGPLLAALSSHFSGDLQLALVVAGCGLLIGASLLWQLQPRAQRCAVVS